MQTSYKIALGALSGAVLIASGLVVQAGGWDNFKLRYAFLSQYLHDQDRELEDLRQKAVNPEENTWIELAELLNGGPPKDGIPSIDNTQFDTADTTPFESDEKVIGVVVNGEAVAYPFGIMNWHEIVNDNIGGVNISVSYCPLCDTIVAFERGATTYGVSGKLYQSCLVMYDRADDTLYSQPRALGIVGPNVNRSLDKIPTTKTTLGAWLAQHPDSKILSTDTGHRRNYQAYPYGAYYTNTQIIFPVRHQDQREHHPKAIITYVWQPDQATPHNRFSGASHQLVHDQLKQAGEKLVRFNQRQIRARWDAQLDTVVVEEMDGEPIPNSTAFAFVFPAFFGE